MYPELKEAGYRIRPGPTGFIEQICIDDKVICDVSGKDGFTGVCLNEFTPLHPDDMFPVTGRLSSGSVSGVKTAVVDDTLTINTEITTEQLAGVFDSRITGTEKPKLALTARVSGSGWLASLGVALPLVVGDDPLQRRTSVGGATRNEVWRLDQNDEDDSEAWLKKVSDTRARWPLWRIGGITVDAPHQYTIWKASGHTTPAMPMEQGSEAPGWISYADRDHSIRVTWKDMQASPPAAMTVDGEQGILWVWLQPPSIRPVKITGTYTSSITLLLQCSGHTA